MPCICSLNLKETSPAAIPTASHRLKRITKPTTKSIPYIFCEIEIRNNWSSLPEPLLYRAALERCWVLAEKWAECPVAPRWLHYGQCCRGTSCGICQMPWHHHRGIKGHRVRVFNPMLSCGHSTPSKIRPNIFNHFSSLGFKLRECCIQNSPVFPKEYQLCCDLDEFPGILTATLILQIPNPASKHLSWTIATIQSFKKMSL